MRIRLIKGAQHMGGNHFGKILFELHQERPTKDYERRKALLLENQIALWDVLKACHREGSADGCLRLMERMPQRSFRSM